MRLVHYSDTPLTEVRSIEQIDYGDLLPLGGNMGKPEGLWVTVEGTGGPTWPQYLRGVHRAPGRHRYHVRLDPDARVLRLDNGEALDAFTARYGVDASPAIAALTLPDRDFRAIDWRVVAADWQGVVIAPYAWSRRMQLKWYYAWDCTSGCIWDAAAIASFGPLAPRQKARQRPVAAP